MGKGKEKIEVINRKIIRSKTADGDLAKQYFHIINSEDKEYLLLVKKYVLSKDSQKAFNVPGAVIDKKYKNYKLYKTFYGMKLQTFFEIGSWLFSLMEWK